MFEQQELQAREGCWRKLRAEMDLLKGEEDVRDKNDAIKPKRRLLDINDESDGERAMDELTRF